MHSSLYARRQHSHPLLHEVWLKIDQTGSTDTIRIQPNIYSTYEAKWLVFLQGKKLWQFGAKSDHYFLNDFVISWCLSASKKWWLSARSSSPPTVQVPTRHKILFWNAQNQTYLINNFGRFLDFCDWNNPPFSFLLHPHDVDGYCVLTQVCSLHAMPMQQNKKLSTKLRLESRFLVQ